jgi:hypothetical protein
MEKITGQAPADQQIAAAIAAEQESLSPQCRADASRLERLLAPDFHEFGSSGGEFGYEGTAARVAAATHPDDEPIQVENMRGWLLADGLVMVTYTSERLGPDQGAAPGVASAARGGAGVTAWALPGGWGGGDAWRPAPTWRWWPSGG